MPYARRIYPNKTRMAQVRLTPAELATAIGSNSLQMDKSKDYTQTIH